MGLVGPDFKITKMENSSAALVESGGSLGKFVIDLKIVGIAIAIFVAASIFSAPLSYILVAVGTIVLAGSYKRYAEGFFGTVSAAADFGSRVMLDNAKAVNRELNRNVRRL